MIKSFHFSAGVKNFDYKNVCRIHASCGHTTFLGCNRILTAGEAVVEIGIGT